jgi:hypothetical protein
MRQKKFQGKIPIPSFAASCFSHGEKEDVESKVRSGWSLRKVDDVYNGNNNGSYHRLCSDHKKDSMNPVASGTGTTTGTTATVTGKDLQEHQKSGSDPKSGDRHPFIHDWTDKGIKERDVRMEEDIEPTNHVSCNSRSIPSASVAAAASHASPCVGALSHFHFEKSSAVGIDLHTLLKIDVALHIHQARKPLPSSFKTDARVMVAAASVGIEKGQKVVALDQFLKIVSKVLGMGSNHTCASVQQFATIYIYIASPELLVVQPILQRIYLVFQQPKLRQEQTRLQAITQLYQHKWKGWQIHSKELCHLCSTLFSPGKPVDEFVIHPTLKTTLAAIGEVSSPLPQLEQGLSFFRQNNHKVTHGSSNSTQDVTSPVRRRLVKQNVYSSSLTNIYLKLAEQLHVYLFQRIRNSTSGPNGNITNFDTKTNTTLVMEIKRHVPMPLRTVCQYLMKSNSLAMGHFQSQKLNIQQIKKLVRELAKIVPEWIQIVNVTMDKDSANKSRKKQCPMVVIKDNVSYESTCEKLGARSMRNIVTSYTVPSHESKSRQKRLREHGSDNIHGNGQEGNANATIAITNNENHSNKKQRTIRLENSVEVKSKLSLLGKRTIHMPPVHTLQPSVSIPSSVHDSANKPPTTTTNATAAIDHSDSTTTILTNRPCPKSKLRVNHHQCMTEEDHNGGFMMQSDTTNPRGLHRLFHKLNAGKRI